MNIDNIADTIHTIVVQTANKEISADAILLENGFDSIKIIELILKVEDRFGIEIDLNDISYSTVKSINTLSPYVFKKIEVKNEKTRIH